MQPCIDILYAAHDILIYLFLLNASLELEPSYSRDLICLLFFQFVIILSETVIINPNVSRDLSVYLRNLRFCVSYQLSTQAT